MVCLFLLLPCVFGHWVYPHFKSVNVSWVTGLEPRIPLTLVDTCFRIPLRLNTNTKIYFLSHWSAFFPFFSNATTSTFRTWTASSSRSTCRPSTPTATTSPAPDCLPPAAPFSAVSRETTFLCFNRMRFSSQSQKRRRRIHSSKFTADCFHFIFHLCRCLFVRLP